MMALLVTATVFCALKAVQSTRLLSSTLWLAAVSALVALMLYGMGAWQFAVIELSVGAGLVTVLLVFGIAMVGEEHETVTYSPRTFLLLAIIPIVLLMAFLLPVLDAPPDSEQVSVSTTLWEDRGLDLVTQIVLIFAGILGVLGLLSEQGGVAASRRSDTTSGQPESISDDHDEWEAA